MNRGQGEKITSECSYELSSTHLIEETRGDSILFLSFISSDCPSL